MQVSSKRSFRFAARSLRAGCLAITFAAISPLSSAAVEVASTEAPGNQSTHSEDGSKAQTEPASSANPVAKVAWGWLKIPALQQSQVGIEILDLPSGQVLYSFNGNRRFTPASTAKVFTTACALETLGADFHYRTIIEAAGPIKKDKLAGDLLIVPSQDPTFETKDLYQLLAALGDKKIKYIDGRVGLSAVPGGSDRFSTGWLGEDWGQEWMPVSSDLVLDRNIAPGKDPGRGLPAVEQVGLSPQPAIISSLLKSDLQAGWVLLDPAARTAKVYRGSFPGMSTAASLVVANPDEYNLAVATTILHSMGVRMRSHPLSVRSDAKPQVLGEHLSKPITDIIRECLKESDNLYAQQLLRTIGAKSRTAKVGEQVTLEESGLTHLKDWLSEIGVRSSDVVLVDGCGLSRKNCLTPHALNMVLKHMAGKELDGPYLALLRLEGGPHSFFRFKTGAMDSVRTVSGIIRSAGGNTMAVTVMVNGHWPQVGAVRSSIYSLTSQLESLPKYRAPADGTPEEIHQPPSAPVPHAHVHHTRHRRRH